MYSVYADDICIYNDSFMLDDTIIIEPVLTLEANAAGSFEFTVPPTNKAYSTIERLKTSIVVKKDDTEIWAGRVTSEEADFWNNRKLYCEGELAFLNDTTQPMAEYHGNYRITVVNGQAQRDDTFHTTIRTFLGALLSYHNANVSDDKKFLLGTVTVHDANDSLYRYTNYEKTIEAINEKLLDKFGGYLIIRKENGVRYLDYLAEDDAPVTNTQTIDFGKNLMDFVRNWKTDEYATVILPLGARQETSPIGALEDYLTVESVNSGSKYIQNESAVAVFGWIEKVVHWDDVTTAAALKVKATAYLNDLQYDTMTIELSALDLHYIDPDIQTINLYDRVVVKSEPHGLNEGKIFPVSKLEIPLDSPENTLFTLGTDIKTSLTDVNNKTSAAILSKIDDQRGSVLDEAKADAAAIMNLKTTGFITITQTSDGTDALYISETRDYTQAQKYWRFNMNGLGYTNDGGTTWETAITMNGEIVANFIKTGTMSADRVRTGKLTSINGNVDFDLTNGTLKMNAGSINIGNKFIVDSSGNLTANNATVKGTFFAGSNEGNNQWVQLSANGKLIGGKGSNIYGYIDYSATFTNSETGTTTYGMKMQTDLLVIGVERLGIKDHNDDSQGLFTTTGQVRVVTDVETDGYGSVTRVTYKTLKFHHGFITTPLDAITND